MDDCCYLFPNPDYKIKNCNEKCVFKIADHKEFQYCQWKTMNPNLFIHRDLMNHTRLYTYNSIQPSRNLWSIYYVPGSVVKRKATFPSPKELISAFIRHLLDKIPFFFLYLCSDKLETGLEFSGILFKFGLLKRLFKRNVWNDKHQI